MSWTKASKQVGELFGVVVLGSLTTTVLVICATIIYCNSREFLYETSLNECLAVFLVLR